MIKLLEQEIRFDVIRLFTRLMGLFAFGKANKLILGEVDKVISFNK